MISKFLASSGSTIVLAVSFVQEATASASTINAWAILVAALFVGAVNFYAARTQRLLAMAEIASRIKPLEQQIEAVAKTIKPVEQKIDELIPVVAKIDTHVNGEKSRAESESARDKLQIELQREIIGELKQARDLLAQAKATSDTMLATATTVAPVPVVPAPLAGASSEAEAHLSEIAVSTDATAKNTAKTDIAVAALTDQTPKEKL